MSGSHFHICKFWRQSLGACVLTAMLATTALAQDDDARKILKGMSDFIAGQKSMTVTFDTDIEVVTMDYQKIQFASSGKVWLSRPDKLRFNRTGGYVDLDVTYDGKTISVLGKNANTYAQWQTSGSVDQLVDRLRDEFGIMAPGADLLGSNIYDALLQDVADAKYIGPAVIDGVECEHLAFRNLDSDWQIWVETGNRPIPRKYVITSKEVVGAPQYTLRVKEWTSNPPVLADAFDFKAPSGATKVSFDHMAAIDEVPPGVFANGGKK